MASASSDIKLPAVLKSSYDVGDELARGKYGVVFSGSLKKTGEACAIKVMLKRGNKREDVLREVEVLKKLSHPAILKIDDFHEFDKEYVLVTELLEGGELFDYVIAKDYLQESEGSYYMKQILEGLAFCHAKNIVHLDLKPENIVLKDKGAKQLKIIDFGTAQDLTKNPSVKAMVGTPEFISPEAVSFEAVTCASDMWAIGVITYVLLTGMSPFLGDDDMETIQNISSGEYEYPEPEEDYEDISALAKEFIDSLLVPKPKDRLTAEQCITHDWIATPSKGGAAKIGTSRLKAFKARRKWMAVARAFKAVNLLNKLKRASSSAESCPLPSDSPSANGGPLGAAAKKLSSRK